MNEETNVHPETVAAPQAAVFQVSAEQVRQQIVAGMKSTGRIFYWIAGLSVLNTILVVTKANLIMLGGLGFTFVVDLVLRESGPQLQPIGFGVDLTIALVFVALGIWAGKGSKAAFFIGMGLYALDCVVLFLIQDWLNIAFHGYFLYLLYQGYQNSLKLQAALKDVERKLAEAQQA